ncbi:secretin receptor-like isoform X2 [Mizuhopecten yessoensis]|uniref:secretin receptor-like isoform X2 n=1 Tax=Mizuhopecten yessoensis TaxID=6573 RepID=UPI000B45ACEB|nr:secretin receptor-like isoform X2 [Mizuhopecten yessoensis]
MMGVTHVCTYKHMRLLCMSWLVSCVAFGTSGSGTVVTISLDEQNRLIMQAELTCLNNSMNTPKPENGSYCSVAWDTISCWPYTRGGETVRQPCPSYVNLFDSAELASRTCTESGTWYIHPVHNTTWSDYSKCIHRNGGHPLIAEHMHRITMMYTIGYGSSLVSLVMAVAIMLYFRKLRCPRNTIHVNMFVSFMLRAAISFMKENMLVEGVGFRADVTTTHTGAIQFIPEGTHWQCKLFFTVFHYLLGTNYMWIFVEGMYLHTLISVNVFSERSSIVWFVLFGWVSPVLFVVPWVIVRSTSEDLLCWNTNPTAGYFWIMRGPIVASVVINFVIFLNTIRILFTKLKAFNTFEARQFRKLAKSTLVLIPLFGVHYIIFVGLPEDVSEMAELVKLYFEMFFNSFQGLFVTMLFCFLNGEVQSEIRKKWRRYRLSHTGGESINRKSNTITSFMSRTRRESAVSNSNSGESKESHQHLNGHSHKDRNSNQKVCSKVSQCLLNNGHNGDISRISHSEFDEDEPMVTFSTSSSDHCQHQEQDTLFDLQGQCVHKC